ncbi:MAG: hypothetical protein Q9187_002557 [Circinaria calcarea]
MDHFEELENMAFNAGREQDRDSAPQPSAAQISGWQRLFNCSYSDAVDRIIQLRSDLSRVRISDEHWEIVRPEKEAEGYDREAYEYEIQLSRKILLKPSHNPEQALKTSAAQPSAYFIVLEGPLDTPLKVQEAGKISTIPHLIKGTGDTGETMFCRVDGNAKEAILEWLSKQQISFRPTFICLSKAKKDLSIRSIYPTLGLDSTLPQFRLDDHSTSPSPAQDEYPVWYFFYGTLSNPEILSRIIALPDVTSPDLRPASVAGGVIRTWADKYKALVDASDDSYTDGWAYRVISEIQEEALLYYETEKYEVVRCEMLIQGDEHKVKGCTFRFVSE